LEDQAARYAATGTAPALAAQRCRALAAVADQLAHLTPEQTTPAELLAALEALRLDLYHWHLHRLALPGAPPARALLPTPPPPPRRAPAGALPAGALLPPHRPPRTPTRTP